MIIKGIIFEDFVNYKKPCMTIEFPHCDFKCDKECGLNVCQNSPLVYMNDLNIPIDYIVESYINNDITKAICFQGLEPFDDFDDVYGLIKSLRDHNCSDDVVIYTGYYENEISDKIEKLKSFQNIIVKFGRYIPNDKPVHDEILDVTLSSHNQYAVKIS